jgi:cobalt-zinc-cadmium efflux system membrane fusion protein
MDSRTKTALTLALGMAVGAGSMAALRPKAAEERTSAPAATARQSIALSPAIAERAGIRTHRVETESFGASLRLLGSVDFDPAKVADVGARISGRITRMLVEPGEHVDVGDPLVQIEGAELGDAMSALLSARANLAAATAHATREEGLGRQQLTTATSVEQSAATASALAAEVRGAEQRLLAIGISEAELRAIDRGGAPPRFVTIRAPLAGDVVERNAVLGQVVDSTEPILHIADLSTVWVELDVFERELPRVAAGDTAEIRSEAHPESAFHGTVNHVGSVVDERTRTAGVRVEVDNTERLLRPGQFVHADLRTHGEPRQAFVVPRAAVTPIEGQTSVFVREDATHFLARAVELGATHGDRVEVTGGLGSGDEIVVAGIFALKSEMQR